MDREQPSDEDALRDLLQQTVRHPGGGSHNAVSFDIRSAPILSKHDMMPLTVNLDPKSQQVVANPPNLNLREFGIHDSAEGQFGFGDSELGATGNDPGLANGSLNSGSSPNHRPMKTTFVYILFVRRPVRVLHYVV